MGFNDCFKSYDHELLIRNDSYKNYRSINGEAITRDSIIETAKCLRIFKNGMVSSAYSNGECKDETLRDMCLDVSEYGILEDKTSLLDPGLIGNHKYGLVGRVVDINLEEDISYLESLFKEEISGEYNYSIDAKEQCIYTEVYRNELVKSYSVWKKYIFIKLFHRESKRVIREIINSYKDKEILLSMLDRAMVDNSQTVVNHMNYLPTLMGTDIVRELSQALWRRYTQGRDISGIADKIHLADFPSDCITGDKIPFDHVGQDTIEEVIVDCSSSGSEQNVDYSKRNSFKYNNFTRSFELSKNAEKYPHSLYMKPGELTEGNLFCGLQDGIYIVKSLNAWQNIATNGDIMGTVDEGYVIRGGRIASYLKGVAFQGNILEIMGCDLIGLSKDQRKLSFYDCRLPFIVTTNVRYF